MVESRPTSQEAQEQREQKSIRCSVSFPAEQYAELERLAKSKRVSLAWVVREATTQYLSDQWPLLEKGD